MGNYIKCTDTVLELVDEGTKRFRPIFRVDEYKLDILKQYCGYIDDMISEFNALSYDVEIDEISMNISISIECEEIIIENYKHVFYELIKHTNVHKFSVSKDNNLVVTLVFPPIWYK